MNSLALLDLSSSTATSNDARMLLFDKLCNPTLSKEVSCPIAYTSDNYFNISSGVASASTAYGFFLPLPQTLIFKALKTDAELTQMCMQVSNKALAEDWDNENDEDWNSYLND
jgi:hypothetical protein